MIDEAVLVTFVSYALIVSSVILLICASASLGRQLADVEYQHRAKINGVRGIQSWINIREHVGRIIVASLTLLTGALIFAEVNLFYRLWINRLTLIFMILFFLGATILDWLGERRQLAILMEDRSTYEMTMLRLKCHSIASKLGVLVGAVSLKDTAILNTQEIQDDVAELITDFQSLQDSIRALDPTYKREI